MRAEIEAVKGGQGDEDRVKDLESHIAELESETNRLIRALELQKVAQAEIEASARRKVEESTKELSHKVYIPPYFQSFLFLMSSFTDLGNRQSQT